jgi:hypothetical protein
VGTKQVVTWCDFVLFCYLIIPKQRGFTQKNGVGALSSDARLRAS